MKEIFLTRARLCFWVLAAPVMAFLLWCATWMDGVAVTNLTCLLMVYIMACFWGINALAWQAKRPALRALDEDCDPRPLVELCQRVLAQNPNSLYFRVYEGYALALMGKQEQARPSARQVQDNPRLWRNLSLLLVWSATLPQDDPCQQRVEEQLQRMVGRLRGKKRALAMEELERRRTLDTLSTLSTLAQVPPQLEDTLLQALTQADCTRTQVGAHLSLGRYYLQCGKPAAEKHLSFVMAHANQLHARVQAERLLCRLPGK